MVQCMVKKLIIELPDDIHAAMLVFSQVTRQSPEEMAAEWVTMAVTAITGKPLQIAKRMSPGSPLGTPTDMPLGTLLGLDSYDTPGTRGGKRAKAPPSPSTRSAMPTPPGST